MKTLIITGGTGGLGTAVVERLARDYQCLLLTREPSSGNAIQADLSDEASVRAAVAEAVARFGAPYGLVHMAGGFAAGSVSQTSTETWQSLLGLNVTSSFFVIREVLNAMERNAAGRIHNDHEIVELREIPAELDCRFPPRKRCGEEVIGVRRHPEMIGSIEHPDATEQHGERNHEPPKAVA